MPFAFGEFELDETLCALSRSGSSVPIQPKVFDLLMYLIRNRDRVVPKHELLDALWPDVAVCESALTRAVNLARLAMQDDGRTQRMIQTVARRGYRFVASVTERRPDSSSAVYARPVLLAPPSSGTDFIGREGVMTRLEGDLASALASHGRCVVMSGEPGIGKTRTVEELSKRVRALGAEALLGWCYEGEGAPPFWPWVQIVRAHIQEVGADMVRSQLGAESAEVGALLPELRETSAAAPESEALPAEQRRFRLFESLVNLLKAAAAQRPLALVLEDVHWADPSSLRVLEFVAREIRRSPILLVVTYRDDMLNETHALRRTLALLARYGMSTRITLQGLAREDVGRLVESLAGVRPTDRLVDTLHDRTAGNPFFVHEIVLAFAADGRLEELGSSSGAQPVLPPAVRDVIGQRIQALSADCRGLLQTAAVIGPDFELPVLLHVSGVDEDQAIALLDEARRAELLREHPRRPGSYRFRHALVQEALYGDQSITRRARLHRRIGEALVSFYGVRSNVYVAALAHHFCRGAQPGTTDRAIVFATEAGRRAMRVLAYEEAARHFERALETFELEEPVDEVRRAQLLIDLGRALGRGGDGERAEAVLGRAASIARAIGAPEILARAAIALAGDSPTVVGLPRLAVDLLREALDALGSRDVPLRVRMLRCLCAHLGACGLVEEAAKVGDEAVELASRLADPVLLVAALNARSSLNLDSESPEDRCCRAREAIRCASRARQPGPARESHLHLASALLEAGDLSGFERAMKAYTRATQGQRPGIPGWYGAIARAMRLSILGRFDDAEEQARVALALGQRLHHVDAMLYFGIQLTQIRFFQGRLAETQETLAKLAAQSPNVPELRAVLALIDSESGRVDAARGELERFATRGFAELRQDAGRLSNLSLLALVCAAVGDVATAEQLYRILVPFRARNVCAFVVACNGSIDLYLGLLALAAGRPEDAVRALRSALDRNSKMNAVPWVAHSRLALSRALLQSGGGRARARTLAASALSDARKLGMARLAEEAARCEANIDRKLGPAPGRIHASSAVSSRPSQPRP